MRSLNFSVKLSTKILLGLLAVTPLILTILWVIVVYFAFIVYPDELLRPVVEYPLVILLINLILLVGTYGPVVFYMIHAARNPELADRKAVWIILIVILGCLAMPIYWLMFVWRDSYYDATG